MGLRDSPVVGIVDHCTILLNDGETKATVYPFSGPNDVPLELQAFLCDEFNLEIEGGETVPYYSEMRLETFQDFWFGGGLSGIMLLGESATIEARPHWEKECLGAFYMRQCYPGRSGHLISGGFLVNSGIRGKGIGKALMSCFADWSLKLGFTQGIFDLVYATNVPFIKMLEASDYKRCGRVKGAGFVQSSPPRRVDSFIYSRNFMDQHILGTKHDEAMSSAESSDNPIRSAEGDARRFQRLEQYLQTGRYPSHADTAEKSRLRAAACKYSVSDQGRLILRNGNREVVWDPARQEQLASKIHSENHNGINRTSAAITAKYYWSNIKKTVCAVIDACPECGAKTTSGPEALPSKANLGIKRQQETGGGVRHVRRRRALPSSRAASNPYALPDDSAMSFPQLADMDMANALMQANEDENERWSPQI